MSRLYDWIQGDADYHGEGSYEGDGYVKVKDLPEDAHELYEIGDKLYDTIKEGSFDKEKVLDYINECINFFNDFEAALVNR